MKVKLLRTTNPLMEEVVGKEGNLSIDLTATFRFEDTSDVSFEFRTGAFHTSRIQSVVYIEVSLFCYEIVVTTRNSTYTFINGERSDKLPFTKEQELSTALSLGYF